MIGHQYGRTISCALRLVGIALVTAGSASAQTPWPFPLQFAASDTYDLATLAVPRAVTAGDFNSDGFVDIIAVGTELYNGPESVPTSAWMLLGRGDGTLESPYEIPLRTGPTNYFRWIVAGLLDGDSHLDFAAFSAAGITIMRGMGDGTFELMGFYDNYIVKHSRCAAATDLDGDGDLDLVGCSHFFTYYGRVWQLYNDGKGNFSQYESQTSDPGFHEFIAVGDLDGDNAVDLVATRPALGIVEIYLNDGTGHFRGHEEISTPGVVPVGVAICDLDDDGDNDLALTDLNGFLRIMENQGRGVFLEATIIPLKAPTAGGGPWYLTAADFNGDGLVDLAYCDALAGGVKYVPNETTDSLAFGFPVPAATGGFPHSAIAANLDNDCDFDLVVANLEGLSISVLLNQTSDVGTCAVADLTLDAAVDAAQCLVCCEWMKRDRTLVTRVAVFLTHALALFMKQCT